MRVASVSAKNECVEMSQAAEFRFFA